MLIMLVFCWCQLRFILINWYSMSFCFTPYARIIMQQLTLANRMIWNSWIELYQLNYAMFFALTKR